MCVHLLVWRNGAVRKMRFSVFVFVPCFFLVDVFFSSSVCVLVKGRNFTRAYLSIVKKLLRLLFFFYFCVSKFTFKNSLFLLIFAIFLLALNYHHHHQHLIDFCYFDFPFFVLGCFVPV